MCSALVPKETWGPPLASSFYCQVVFLSPLLLTICLTPSSHSLQAYLWQAGCHCLFLLLQRLGAGHCGSGPLEQSQGQGRLGTWAGCPGTLGVTCPSCKCLYKRPGLPITLLAAGMWRGWNRQPGSGPGAASSKLATLGKATSACPASVFSSVKQGWL